MTAIGSLLVVLTLSFLITRLATVALTLSGLSADLARLQAVSAFTGVGFTTAESEHVVSHPVRRRILMLVMIVGNAGIVTAMASLILSFTGVQQTQEGLVRGLWLVGGVALLWVGMTRRLVETGMDRVMRWALSRWSSLRPVDYAELLDLSGDYRVREISVESHDWMEGRTLDELELFDEGITVLGIHRIDGYYVGVPRGETRIDSGDRLILYGREDDLTELDDRLKGPSGDEAHERARREQSEQREAQRRRQAQRDRPTHA
jgi:hypothetical protein